MERNLVTSQLPSVSVPNIGDNILDFIDFIEKIIILNQLIFQKKI